MLVVKEKYEAKINSFAKRRVSGKGEPTGKGLAFFILG
jgi:hypothetical protein